MQPIFDRLGGNEHGLVDISYVKDSLVLNRWKAAGGVLLIFGGFSASGGDETVNIERVAVVIRLSGDSSYVLVELPSERVRLVLDRDAFLELEWLAESNPMTNYGMSARYDSIPEMIREVTSQYVLHLPQTEINAYVGVALSMPLARRP